MYEIQDGHHHRRKRLLYLVTYVKIK